ncbi:MAG: hypothetical protein ACYDHP_10830 [Ferrimicrobium sp.]
MTAASHGERGSGSPPRKNRPFMHARSVVGWANYKGPDRRSRDSSAVLGRGRFSIVIRVGVVVVLVVLVAVTAQVMVTISSRSLVVPRMDAIDDLLSTAVVLLAALAALGYVLDRRLTGHAGPALLGAGALFVFVASPLVSRVPFLVGNLDATWVFWANLFSLSAAIVGTVLLLAAPVWPEVDTTLRTRRLVVVAVALMVVTVVGLSFLPTGEVLSASAIPTLFSRRGLVGTPNYLVYAGGIRWLALVGVYAWRSRGSLESLWMWTAGALVLGAIAFGISIVTPVGTNVVMCLDLLAAGESGLLLVGAASALDTALDTQLRVLREAATIRRSQELTSEAFRVSWGRYMHDLRSSVTGISLYLDWSLSAAEQSSLEGAAAIPCADVEELVHQEVQRIEGLARSGPILVIFELRSMLEKWCSSRIGDRGFTLDVPVGLWVLGPKDLLAEVLSCLVPYPGIADNGPFPIQFMIRSFEFGGEVVVEVTFQMRDERSTVHVGGASRWQHVQRSTNYGAIVRSSVAFEACRRMLHEESADLWILADQMGFAVALRAQDDIAAGGSGDELLADGVDGICSAESMPLRDAL